MKIRTVWEARSALIKVLTCPNFDINVSWRLKPLVKQFMELEETLRELAGRFETEEQNGELRIVPGQRQEYQAELQKLLDEEFNTSVNLTLREIEKASLTPMELHLLEWLIEEK